MTPLPPESDNAPDQALTQQLLRANRNLMLVVALLLAAVAGLAGWVIGRGTAAPNPASPQPVAAPHLNVHPRVAGLLRGIHCSHGTAMAEAQCPDGEEMRRYITELMNQGLPDDEIKIAMLRRFGEPALAGREW